MEAGQGSGLLVSPFTCYSIEWHVNFNLFSALYYPVECYMGLSP